MAELSQLLAEPVPPPADGRNFSEAAVQSELRLTAPKYGGHLWRNNVGAFVNDSGAPVRYGLANDSSKLNKKVKSSDLVGFFPFKIAPHHVGKTLAVFAAIECKRSSWYWNAGTRERAQRRFIDIVKTGGGVAGFARSAADLSEIISSHGSK